MKEEDKSFRDTITFNILFEWPSISGMGDLPRSGLALIQSRPKWSEVRHYCSKNILQIQKVPKVLVETSSKQNASAAHHNDNKVETYQIEANAW